VLIACAWLSRHRTWARYAGDMDHVTNWGSRLRETDLRARLGDVLSGAACGAVGAMAMTGMRVITTELGLVEQTPPQAVSRQHARGLRVLVRRAPRKQRRGFIEAAHWAFGPGGGAAFGALPRGTSPPSVDRTDLRIGGVVGL